MEYLTFLQTLAYLAVKTGQLLRATVAWPEQSSPAEDEFL